jgi:23S rRNA (uridine2552-2'-O)-methyltransferase
MMNSSSGRSVTVIVPVPSINWKKSSRKTACCVPGWLLWIWGPPLAVGHNMPRIIALDILPMDDLPGVEFIEGDFREDEVIDSLMKTLGGAAVDLVMSDMAPNISGMEAVDQPRSMYLMELATDFAANVLCKGGDLLFKGFHGEGFDVLIRNLRSQYRKVLIRKPKASRPRSREVYVLAKGRKAPNVS